MIIMLIILLLSKGRARVNTKLTSVIALLYNNRIITPRGNDYNVVFYLRGYLRM